MSENTNIAKVSASGLVTAVAPGKTSITIRKLTNNQKATCTIEVYGWQDEPETPTVAKYGSTWITLDTQSGCVYSVDGIHWQSSPAFVNLKPNTEYTFYVKRPTSGYYRESKAVSVRVRTLTEEVQAAPAVTVRYRTHVQTYGWQTQVTNGAMSGTSGQAKRLEGIEIAVSGNQKLGIQYTTHCQTYGWLPWSSNGEMNGTEGEAKRLEAIKIQLTGADKDKYDLYYRVHAQSYGWLGWAKNGGIAGTSGMAKRLEVIQIKLVPKNSDTSQCEDGKKAYIKGTPTANYSTQALEVLSQCNAERQANGIAAHSLDPELTKEAYIRAQEIATLISHTRPDGRKCFTVLDQIGYSYWSAGENIAAGYGNSSAVMNGWMNSPGHRSNILNAGFKRLGVGYVYIPNSEYGYYWVQIFSN